MENISKGIVAIDKVGKDFDNSMWQDDAYVMHTGLAKIKDTNAFEENLREMFCQALEILNKDAFILAFDDIDVDVEHGWDVLESLRRYLSDTHIISIVSGNIKLYGTLVRSKLDCNLMMPEGKAREMMANEMENQYMLKLLNPSNRINLLSLGYLCQNSNVMIKVLYKGDELELVNFYRKILKGFGIVDSSSIKTFVSFLLSMSLRSQIHFMKNASEKKDIPPLDVFSSRLYASGIDIAVLETNAQILNIVLLDYLNAKAYLPDCYLLMPTLQDKDINSNFTAFTLIECWHLKNNPFLAFDFMLRIGFVRNVVLPLEEEEMVLNLCKYAGWSQMMSLKNNVALSMAYVLGKKIGGMNENIRLFAMEEKAKKGKGTQMNALDYVLKEEVKPFVRLMAMFPFIRITNNKNNESRSYYSLIALLAVIGEVLKCVDKEDMIGRLNDLKLFRSYRMPQEENSYGEEEYIKDDNYGVETKADDIDELASMMSRWKETYNECHVPPYVLGRIMTRLYTSLPNVVVKSVGEMMNVMVTNFFNACLIEETKLRIPAELGIINNSNLRSETRYFKDNLGKADVVNRLPFTKWIMSCPMLCCFLDKETYDKVQEFVVDDEKIDRNYISVYDLLCRLNSKNGNEVQDEIKPSFSGTKVGGWKRTLDIMLANGISDDTIQEKIIDEENVDNSITFVNATGLFKRVNRKSVVSFKNNYHAVEPKKVAEQAQANEVNPVGNNE